MNFILTKTSVDNRLMSDNSVYQFKLYSKKCIVLITSLNQKTASYVKDINS